MMRVNERFTFELQRRHGSNRRRSQFFGKAKAIFLLSRAAPLRMEGGILAIHIFQTAARMDYTVSGGDAAARRLRRVWRD